MQHIWLWKLHLCDPRYRVGGREGQEGPRTEEALKVSYNDLSAERRDPSWERISGAFPSPAPKLV